MRILQLMKWLSPREDTGGKIRSYRIGQTLASFAHVDAAGFVLPGEGVNGKEAHLSHYRRLYPFPAGCKARTFPNTLSAFARGLSLRTSRFSPSAFRPFVKEILRENQYDALQVEELPLMSALGPLARDLPVIYSAHNVESALSPLIFGRRNRLLGLLEGMERRRTAAEERRALAKATACLAVSEKDRDALRRLSPGAGPPIRVLPNCAHDRFAPPSHTTAHKGILAVGAFGWYPNREGMTWFMHEILPLLRKTSPAVKIRIAGSSISKTFRREMERRGFEVHPDVPDILPFLQAARLLFVPLRIGGGTRIKIVEAWAAGLPVVATSVGAEALGCRCGVDILVADDPGGFAGAVQRLLEDDGLHRKVRSAGLNLARGYRWSSLKPSLEDVYREVLRGGGTEFA